MKSPRMPVLSLPFPRGIASVRRGKLHHALLLGMLLAVAGNARDALAETLHVKNVALSTTAPGTAEVLISTTGSPQFSARVDAGGTRLVVDIDGADVQGAPGAITKGNAIVGGVMTQGYSAQGLHTARVFVHLAHAAEYQVTPEASGLRVSLVSADKTGPMRAGPVPVVKSEGAGITDVRFDHQVAADRIIVDLSGTVDYTESAEAGRTIVEVRGAHLPDTLQRKLDTAAFGGPVRGVSMYRRKSDPRRVVIEVDRAPDWSAMVVREGASLVLTLHERQDAVRTMSGVGSDGGIARKSRTVARDEDMAAGAPRVDTCNQRPLGARSQRRARPSERLRSRRGRGAAASLHGAPHRPRPQGRRHPQRPAAARRRGPRQHRHGGRRDGGPSPSACATSPGTRRSTPCFRPRASGWCGRAT